MRPLESVASSPAVPVGMTRRGGLIAVASIGTLVVSRLPEIVLREGFGLATPWMEPTLIAMAGLLWSATRLIGSLRPLSGYFAVMTGVLATVALVGVILRSTAWASLVSPSADPMVVLLSERLLLGAVALIFVACLFVVGGRDAGRFLRLRRSPETPTAVRAGVRWTIAGPVAMVILMTLTAAAMAQAWPSAVDLGAAAPFLVMAVLAAIVNSYWEEAVFRAAPLGRLAPVIGAGPAVVILAVWFGLGHFYGGIPSGVFGAVMVSLVGLVLGRAMTDTRGLTWPWLIHFSIDLTIYTVLALGG